MSRATVLVCRFIDPLAIELLTGFIKLCCVFMRPTNQLITGAMLSSHWLVYDYIILTLSLRNYFLG